jgi:hypothetical protein
MMNLPVVSNYQPVVSDQKIQPQLMEIRDIVHAAKLLRLLKGKESLIASQLSFVRAYLKENS